MADAAHDFVIVIPVADRPRHLSDCLASLLELTVRYPYDGAVTVLVADDSLAAENRARHRDIAAAFTAKGLDVRYLDQDEQRALVEALPPDLRARLAGVVGGGGDYARKGASITRNIAYLWLNRLGGAGGRRLFWFIDSDQEFRVNVETAEGEAQPYGVDYLHGLDRIFSETGARILTGKVVGDPPVSPAVMAGTFLDDVLAFVAEMAALPPGSSCSFHGGAARSADEAAYHDMADLFGFRTEAEAWRYRCPIRDSHDHAACFADFAARLDRFFDGEHPTRRGYYRADDALAPDDALASVRPARTVYTGNYVITAAGLEWFVPFAALKLRMAGPTLGRIVRAEIGDAFVSANLPMLHKRTVADAGRSECRPGVEREAARVDLSGEFERQYFGDVMLFAIERLAGRTDLDAAHVAATVDAVVDAVEAELRAKYRAKHAEVADKAARLADLLGGAPRWWHDQSLAGARADFDRFAANLGANFAADAPAWRRIESAPHRQARKAAIAAAILAYRADRAAWREALGRTGA